MDRAIEALDAGELDRVRVLCEEMKHEWLMLHDLMAESLLGLISFVQERLGDDGVAEAWGQATERGWRRHHDAIGRLDRRELVYLLAATWRAHSGSGIGEHPGRFAISEDDEKITFTTNPCGSGQRLVRRGLYESMGYGRTRAAHDSAAPHRSPARDGSCPCAARSADESRGSTSRARSATAAPPPTAALRPPRSSRARSAQTNPGSENHRTLRWSTFQPAQVVQFSPGADIFCVSERAVRALIG
jgi:hypothetical protein